MESYAQDLVHGVTRGEMITAKHYLLALGLHNISCQKNVVDIINKLGHCISYSLTCDIETAQAEIALEKSKQTTLLPVKPNTTHQIVLTYFWVDNFDMNIERQCGGGALNTTHLIAFQEESQHSFQSKPNISIPRNKSHKLFIDAVTITNVPINVSRAPPKYDFPVQSFEFDDHKFSSIYLVWLFIRKQNSYDQAVTSFSRLLTQIRSNYKIQDTKKTIETYLPPINSKVTDFATNKRYFDYLQTVICRFTHALCEYDFGCWCSNKCIQNDMELS